MPSWDPCVQGEQEIQYSTVPTTVGLQGDIWVGSSFQGQEDGWFQAMKEKNGTEIQKDAAVHGAEHISLAFSQEKAPEEI